MCAYVDIYQYSSISAHVLYSFNIHVFHIKFIPLSGIVLANSNICDNLYYSENRCVKYAYSRNKKISLTYIFTPGFKLTFAGQLNGSFVSCRLRATLVTKQLELQSMAMFLFQWAMKPLSKGQLPYLVQFQLALLQKCRLSTTNQVSF